MKKILKNCHHSSGVGWNLSSPASGVFDLLLLELYSACSCLAFRQLEKLAYSRYYSVIDFFIGRYGIMYPCHEKITKSGHDTTNTFALKIFLLCIYRKLAEFEDLYFPGIMLNQKQAFLTKGSVYYMGR